MLTHRSLPLGEEAPTGHHTPEVQALLARGSCSATSFYPADSVIYAQGEPAGPLYLVEFGTVRICQVSKDGRRQINTFHFSGEVFGFEAETEHQCYAESVDGAGIRTLRPVPDLPWSHQLLRLALRDLNQVQEHLMMLGRMSAIEKMAKFLRDLSERQNSDCTVALQMQRNDIADYLGLTFETVSRVLRALKDRRIIQLRSVDRIEVLDAEALAELCR